MRSASGIVIAAALLGAPGAGVAEVTVELALASDFVFRGYSHSDSAPAAQAGLRYRSRGGFVGGIWGSTVDFPGDAPGEPGYELHLFAGYARSWGQQWSWSAVAVRYEYPDADARRDLSYTEGELALAWRELVRLSVAYTPDFLAGDRTGVFVELTGRYPLGRRFWLSAGVGRADLDIPIEPGYSYGHAAAAWEPGRWELTLGYYVGDARPVPRWGEAVDGRWVASVTARLP